MQESSDFEISRHPVAPFNGGFAASSFSRGEKSPLPFHNAICAAAPSVILFCAKFEFPGSKLFFRSWSYEIRFSIGCCAVVRDGSSGAAGDHVESVDPAELHCGAQLVSHCVQAVPAGDDPAAHHGEFAAAA